MSEQVESLSNMAPVDFGPAVDAFLRELPLGLAANVRIGSDREERIEEERRRNEALGAAIERGEAPEE